MKKFFYRLRKILHPVNPSKKPIMIRDRTFRVWLVRSLCVVSVFILCGTLIYNIAMQTARQVVMKARSDSITQTGELIDDFLLNVREDVSMLINNSTIIAASYIGSPTTGSDFYAYHAAGEQCRSIYLYGNITDIFVYFEKGDCFVDCFQLYYNDEVEPFIQERCQVSLAQWKETVSSLKYARFLYLGDALFFICPLKNGSSERGVLMAEIDANQMETYLHMDADLSGVSYIINSIGAVLSSTSPLSNVPYSYNSLQSGTNFIKNNVVTSYKLEQLDGEYISIIPAKQYTREIAPLKIVLYFYFAFCILGGVWLVYLETKHRYQPIQDINLELETSDAASDSFLSLRKKVLDMLQSNRDMQSILQKEQTLYFEGQFASWLYGQVPEKEIQTMLQNSFGMKFSQGVMIFASILPRQPGDDMDLSDLMDMTLICLNNITAELLGPEYRCFFWNYEGLVGMVWSDKEIIGEKFILELFDKVRINIWKYFSLDLRLSISKTFQNLSDISTSYREARITNDYCRMKEQSGVVLYKDSFQQPFSTWKNKVILEIEREFTTYMMDRDYPRAKAKMEQIIDYYKLTDGISIQLLRCRMFNLINLMLDATLNNSSDENILSLVPQDYLQKLLQAETIPKLEEELMGMLQQLIQRDAESHGSIQQKIELIDQYIENHYNDPALSVQMLADRFHLSVPYLSSTYKQMKQIGILQKIQFCRIQHAKELLVQEPDMPLAQIAAKIGYGNVQTMIRIFKKLENETPGKYREMHTNYMEGKDYDK